MASDLALIFSRRPGKLPWSCSLHEINEYISVSIRSPYNIAHKNSTDHIWLQCSLLVAIDDLQKLLIQFQFQVAGLVQYCNHCFLITFPFSWQIQVQKWWVMSLSLRIFLSRFKTTHKIRLACFFVSTCSKDTQIKSIPQMFSGDQLYIWCPFEK